MIKAIVPIKSADHEAAIKAAEGAWVCFCSIIIFLCSKIIDTGSRNF
jgi:hypothetical protein